MIDFKYVTEANFNSLIDSAKKPIMVYFWTAWSSDCKREEAVLNKVKERYYNDVEFFAVNIDECPNIRSANNINIVPTVAFYANGKLMAKEIGNKSEAIYYSHIKRLI